MILNLWRYRHRFRHRRLWHTRQIIRTQELFAEFFEKEDVRYLNFNREYFADFSHEITNFTDYDGHMNGDAAREYSRVLGEVLDAIPSNGIEHGIELVKNCSREYTDK